MFQTWTCFPRTSGRQSTWRRGRGRCFCVLRLHTFQVTKAPDSWQFDSCLCVWLTHLHHFLSVLSAEDLSFRWMLNEFPEFIPLDKRRFVSQTTGNLYISTVRASDSGNYSCFVSSPSIAKSVFSKFIPLVPIAERESVYHHPALKKMMFLLSIFPYKLGFVFWPHYFLALSINSLNFSENKILWFCISRKCTLI